MPPRVQRIRRATAQGVPGWGCLGPSIGCPACLRAPSTPLPPVPGTGRQPHTQDQTSHLPTVQRRPPRVRWQVLRAGERLSLLCCVSSFYLGPGRAQARGAGTSVGARDPLKVPWPRHPHPCKMGPEPSLRGTHSSSPNPRVTPEELGPRCLGGLLSLSQLPPWSVASLSFSGFRSPPPTVPEPSCPPKPTPFWG